MSKVVITFGTYDLLHVGHTRLLERAKAQGDRLIVGVSSDKLNFSKKQKNTFYSQEERMEIIRSLKCVDEVFLEESLELKDEYIKKYGADLLVMGDDWVGRFDWVSCDTMYLPRTEGISTTELVETIREE